MPSLTKTAIENSKTTAKPSLRSGTVARQIAPSATHVLNSSLNHPSQDAGNLAIQRVLRTTAAPPIVHESLRTSGRPLDDAARAFFEPRLGADLSEVRLHTDDQAAQGALDIHAKAFTHGQDIYFGHGFYQPGTQAGDKLLAHELTHTLQQENGASVQS